MAFIPHVIDGQEAESFEPASASLVGSCALALPGQDEDGDLKEAASELPNQEEYRRRQPGTRGMKGATHFHVLALRVGYARGLPERTR